VSEEKRKETLERREFHKKLSEIILAGTEYFETVTVKGIDGKDYEVPVYALSDEQYRQAIESSGVNPKSLVDRTEILSHMKLAQAIAPIATRDPDICKVIKPAQSFMILEKVLAISDFPFRATSDIREKPVQPAA